MDVRLPDGTVVQNVPEGTTQSELVARVGKMRGQSPEPKSSGMGALELAATMFPPSTLPKLAEFSKPMVLPTAGGMVTGGLTAGMSTVFPGMAPAIPAAIGVGQGLGEYANQKLGITPPSNTAIGINALMPVALQWAGKLGTAMLKHLPGASPVLHEMGADTARKAAAKIAPSESSDVLFGKLDQMTQTAGQAVMLPANKLAQAAQEILAREAKNPVKALERKDVMELAQSVLDATTNNPNVYGVRGTFSVPAFQALKSRLGQAMKFDATKTTPYRDSASELFGAMANDLKDAAKSAAGGQQQKMAQLLSEATEAVKLERTADDVLELINKNIVEKAGPSDFIEVRGATMLNALRGNKRFQALNEATKQAVIDTLKPLKRLPALPKPEGVNAGSINVLTRTTGVGGLVGGLTANPALGATAAGVAAVAPPLISAALQTGPGRALLKGLLIDGKGTLSPAGLAALSTFLAQSTQKLAPGNVPTDLAPLPTQ